MLGAITRMKGQLIQFLRKKDYKFIEEIGQGGTGRTVLLEDEIINERFVCKKYSPFYKEHKKVYFDNFKDEIKLLHLLYHRNVVRVFNYYLYPEEQTGYILMEFVKGQDISSFSKDHPDKLNEIFRQTIEGFVHLESSKILHRDIRPDNILISTEGIVKIIDFGFSKKINFETDYDKSVSLNWRYDPPNDFENKLYDFKTELYFVGKLFEEILRENNFQNFVYKDLLKGMVEPNPENRIISFFKLQRDIISESTPTIEFTNAEKKVYQDFASGLQKIFTKIDHDAKYISDIQKILQGLQDVHRNSILEEIIQNPNLLARCFILGNFRYQKDSEIKVKSLHEFSQFLSSTTGERQRIILNNLWQRLDNIQRYDPNDFELPF